MLTTRYQLAISVTVIRLPQEKDASEVVMRLVLNVNFTDTYKAGKL